MNPVALPGRRTLQLGLMAGVVCTLAVTLYHYTSHHGVLDPFALASKGCRMISKTMTAGDIDAILAGRSVHLDNPDGGYCFNPPVAVTSK